jgi:hypothetical protein
MVDSAFVYWAEQGSIWLNDLPTYPADEHENHEVARAFGGTAITSFALGPDHVYFADQSGFIQRRKLFDFDFEQPSQLLARRQTTNTKSLLLTDTRIVWANGCEIRSLRPPSLDPE